MDDYERELDEVWQIGVERWMCRIILETEEPYEVVRVWFDEALEGDEAHLRWAMDRWQFLENLTTLDLEKYLAALRARGSAQ